MVATEVSAVYYEFVVAGSVEGVRLTDRVKAEDNDTIASSDGGLVAVRGFTGNPGWGDAFRFAGTLRSFRRTGGDAGFFVRLDGERVDVDDLV